MERNWRLLRAFLTGHVTWRELFFNLFTSLALVCIPVSPEPRK
jgi:hypothetical protein